MESRWDALMAMQKRLGTNGNPLIDLRCLDSDMAQKMEDRYTEQYMAAREGDEMPHEDRLNALFTTYVSDDAYTPTKGDVLAAWEIELRQAFPKAYMEDYTREEALTFFDLLNKKHVGESIGLRLSPGFVYNIFALLRGWNETHPDEKPISFSGYGDYMS